MLKTIGTQMTIADYCEEFLSEKIYVNKDYQRSDERWTDQARKFLIKSILLGFPLPKFYLYPITDTKRRRSLKEIVDGQQRTAAIIDFYSGDLQISSNFEIENLRKKSYKDLPEDFKREFLEYPLSIDLFTDISEEDIYEVFRRMNSNAQTLTPEEIRHAQFQGKFKWFVYRQGRQFEKLLSQLKVFGPRQFIKMLDLRWITELIDTFDNGIRTTKGSDFSAIYQKYDKTYPARATHAKYLDVIRRRLLGLKGLEGTAITRPHVLASMVMAVVHLQYSLPSLAAVYKVKRKKAVDLSRFHVKLRTLSRALEQKDDEGPLAEIVLASTAGTNVKKARETRFSYFCDLFTSQS